jgi:sigma-E factor negative regulatory protein RseA
MNDALRMQISAFVDGELPDNETELLLRRLSQDAALRQLVAQYLAIGRLVRGEREIPRMGELRSRIATALGEQPADGVPATAATPSRWLKPAGGFAVAASVAALALIGLRQVEAPPGGGADEAQRASVGRETGNTESRPYATPPAEPSETLMQYYVRHGETSADLGANGILARLVTLELRHEELVEIDPAGSTSTIEDQVGTAGAPENASDDNNGKDDGAPDERQR